MTLVRVEETDSGGFTVLNLPMVARVKCAGFDGRDRWLKRINVARDLRKSRAVRKAPASRVIL